MKIIDPYCVGECSMTDYGFEVMGILMVILMCMVLITIIGAGLYGFWYLIKLFLFRDLHE